MKTSFLTKLAVSASQTADKPHHFLVGFVV